MWRLKEFLKNVDSLQLKVLVQKDLVLFGLTVSIAVDDVLDVKVVNGMITLVKPFGHKTLEERAADFNGKLNLDGEYDWGEPVVKEVWNERNITSR